MKKLLVRGLFVVLCSICFAPAKSNDLAWYTVGPTHPAYMTAGTFSSDPDFIRGFCFGWDSLKEWVNFGFGNIMTRQVSVGNGNNLVMTIGMNTIHEVYRDAVATTCADSAEGVRQYALTLTNQADQNLWLGYACLMEQASGNPLIVHLQLGQSF
jgi:hypothetical protein